MGTHRAQAQFERARWNRTYLGPIWVLQLLLSLALVALFSARLGTTARQYRTETTPIVELVWEAANVVMSFITGVCTVVEMAKYISESLTPWALLFLQTVKLTCATSILVLDVVIYARKQDRFSIVGLALDIAQIVAATAMVVYAITAYRRSDDYAHPVNVRGYGFHDGLGSYSDGLCGSRPGMRSLDTRAPRLSLASMAYEPLSMQQAEMGVSRRYSHERDTRFDDYLSRQGALSGHRADLDRSTPTTPPLMAAGGRSSLPSETATVEALATRSRGTSLSQSRGLSDHTLVAVPEEGEVMEYRSGSESSLRADSDEYVKVPLMSKQPRWR